MQSERRSSTYWHLLRYTIEKCSHTPLNCNGIEEEEEEEEDLRGGVGALQKVQVGGVKAIQNHSLFLYAHTTIKIKALILYVFKVDPPLDETGPRDHLECLKD